ncbi:NAD-dependent protein deacetylase sirtuin-2-like [Anopheles maculipalpis]|uniref:NAD-dependent protein deacetylase sirtuin-2-like n=1 Tax=Anopheles maculipalpis TaxID=1496333 RepID=UPI002159B32E|nr:NAD-dependent protein deacetylase sirtuin-2-like [Anopheles maculipalpis]
MSEERPAPAASSSPPHHAPMLHCLGGAFEVDADPTTSLLTAAASAAVTAASSTVPAAGSAIAGASVALTEPASDPTITPLGPSPPGSVVNGVAGPDPSTGLPDFLPYDDTEDDDGEDSISIERIRQYLSDKLGFYTADRLDDKDGADGGASRRVLETVDIEGVLKHWKNGGFKKIVTMVGAGISTSAGIPDFRSPDTGLYNNLMKYNLPYPQAIFELEYLYRNPKPFFTLAKELYPGTFKPTPSHYFVRLLEQKGLLVRHYTQNIDTLERIAGISEEKIVEAHGTFYTNHCLQCKTAYSLEFVKEIIFTDEVPTCPCGGVIKPDIVFFGEGLPERFHMLPHQDFAECDLLIIMGTSLTVQPFASLVEYANDSCVRLLINRDKVGCSNIGFLRSMMFGEGLCFDLPGNRRDVAWTGNCDDGCFFLADQLGWGDELRKLIETEHAKIKPIRPLPVNPAVAPSVEGTDGVVDMEPTPLADIGQQHQPHPILTDDQCLDESECLVQEDEHFNDIADGLSTQGAVGCPGVEESVQAMATDSHHDHEPSLHAHHHHHHEHHTSEVNDLHHHHHHHNAHDPHQQHEKMDEHHDDEVVLEQHPKAALSLEDKT